MKIIDFIKVELKGFTLFEKIFFPLEVLLIIYISILLNDNKIALVSAICGICYTILAGKGKIYCYYIGLIGTFCYCYIAYKNGFYGNLVLYSLYYFPMQILGIFKWKKHLKKDTKEIIKTCLNIKERIVYFSSAIICTFLFIIILILTNDKAPFIDGICTIFSILGQILTIKRCIEQWYIWFIVNLLTLIMWIIAYINGSNCLATIFMWATYLFLAIYFLLKWKKEINNENL